MSEVQNGLRLTTEELKQLGMTCQGKRVGEARNEGKVDKHTITVRQMKDRSVGIGTSIPDYFVDKFQELAGNRELTAEDVAMCFRGYLALAEEQDAQVHMNRLLGNILREYLEWKERRANE
jgi:hypothetical protein